MFQPSYSNEKFDKAIVSEEDDTVRNKFSNSFAGFFFDHF